ncbi:hypothetical protein TraAM80_01320 [Trypanosoma rangeli]|uniref:Uncharacterized protein n=1 Tax=Trypanosoma rangeli TaxID=5698 RepID=A0A3R7NS34_TRYRA|nr:uncharacterized protein TraAM80_01320 [Trypanosoma rangeli]RNF10759.1 hypothetical protein TraAM80_01320 [Trypanosoma rangeli]|eukprot:RNF10759.1 hypothetical protein TraAM80_01320 [Trypanosoma rangeli]
MENGEDAPLWFITPPDLQPQNIAAANDPPAGAPPLGFSSAVRCQLRLVPLIKRYFFAPGSVLFQQLLDAGARQHLRYHFHCTQRLPPTVCLDPTMQCFELEQGGREVRVSAEAEVEGHKETVSAPLGLFSAPRTLYKLLVETTEGNLLDGASAFNAALRTELEGGSRE